MLTRVGALRGRSAAHNMALDNILVICYYQHIGNTAETMKGNETMNTTTTTENYAATLNDWHSDIQEAYRVIAAPAKDRDCKNLVALVGRLLQDGWSLGSGSAGEGSGDNFHACGKEFASPYMAAWFWLQNADVATIITALRCIGDQRRASK
jgi:hypothetical protein